ncbi:hypothetical protein [Melghiribacillus thermohalophilus]|nr:hypothetical protein [Melghiribacillus thermohalophilus]
MRQWRIGTFSMGLSLLFLGVILVLAKFFHWDMTVIAFSWWPVILIVLGLEILIYLFQSKEQTPILKYDVLSILFIGMIGTAGIGLYVIQSTGILAEIQKAVHAEEKVEALPVVQRSIPSDISKIVVHPSDHLNIETTSKREAILFGIYETDTANGKKLSQEELVQFIQTGEILHIQVLSLPEDNGIYHSSYRYDPTLSIPENIDVEIKVGWSEYPFPTVKLHIDELKANWEVRGNRVGLYMDQWENLTISASNVGRIEDSTGLVAGKHDIQEKENDDTSEFEVDKQKQGPVSFTKTFGDGKYSIAFKDVRELSIHH